MFDHVLNVGIHILMFGGNLFTGFGFSSEKVKTYKTENFVVETVIFGKSKCTAKGKINGECSIEGDIFTIKDNDKKYTWIYEKEGEGFKLYDSKKDIWIKFRPD